MNTKTAFGAIVLFSAMTFSQQPYFKTYVATGINDVNDIACDSSFVWLTTNAGLLRRSLSDPFDYRPFSDSTLQTNVFGELALAPDGRIWILSDSLLILFDGTGFQEFQQVSINGYNPIVIDSSGNIWVGTRLDGVYMFSGNDWFQKSVGLPQIASYNITAMINDLTISSEHEMWAATDSGIYYWNNNAWNEADTTLGFTRDKAIAISFDQTGDLWFSTRYQVNRFNGNAVDTFRIDASWAYEFTFDVSGNTWFCAGDGLYEIAGNAIQRFDTSDGLERNSITDITADIQGTIWYSTNSSANSPGGVSQFEGGTCSGFNVPEIAHNDVSEIMLDSEGKKWIVVSGGKLSIFNDTDWVECNFENAWAGIPPVSGLIAISDFYISPDGAKWFFHRNGVYVLRQNQWTILDSTTGLHNIYITDVIADKHSTVWVSTTNAGLFSISTDFNVHNITVTDGLRSNSANSLAADSDSSIWIAYSSKGISKYSRGNWLHYDTSNGLYSNEVIALLHDSRGNLWVGDEAISKFDGSVWSHYEFPGERPIQRIFDIAEDSSHSIWVSGDHGLAYQSNGNWIVIDTINGYSTKYTYALSTDRTGIIWADVGGVTAISWTPFSASLPSRNLSHKASENANSLLVNIGAYRILPSGVEPQSFYTLSGRRIQPGTNMKNPNRLLSKGIYIVKKSRHGD